PVPHMSVRFPWTRGLIWTQFARMARTIDATSSTFGPFISSATRKPAICTSLTTSSRMFSMNSVTSASDRLSPRLSLPSESLNIGAPVDRWWAGRRNLIGSCRRSRRGVGGPRGEDGRFAGMNDFPPAERTLPALLERQAAAFGERPYLRIGDTLRSYAEMRDAVARTAGSFAAAGVTRGDRVAIMCE